jgi:hypothetical protein
MATYTIYDTPYPTGRGPGETAAFVSEGFCLAAFLFGPVWLIWHRLWAGLVLFAGLSVLVILGHWLAGLSWSIVQFALLLIAFALGLEGRSLLRDRLVSQGYRLVDVVTAPGRTIAERIYFSRRRVSEQPTARSVFPASFQETPVIGTFPMPGGF